jgi:hypothetical protein
MWMNQDDYVIRASLDLNSTVKQFVEQYQSVPLMLNGSCDSVHVDGDLTTNIMRACYEANVLVQQIEEQTTFRLTSTANQTNNDESRASMTNLHDLIATLSRGVFFSDGRDDIAIGPIRIPGIVNTVLEYLDCSCHG